MKDKIRKEVMKVFNQEASVDTVVDNILLLFGVSNSLDLVELERKIDKALDNETSESLKTWLHSKRL